MPLIPYALAAFGPRWASLGGLVLEAGAPCRCCSGDRLGTGSGVRLGLCAGRLGRLRHRDFATVTAVIPWSQVLLVVTVAALAGLLASVVPARRADRLSPGEKGHRLRIRPPVYRQPNAQAVSLSYLVNDGVRRRAVR